MRTRHNVVANFSGRVVQGLVSLAVIPVYVRLIGIEAYGLVGLLTGVQLLANLFDFGLSATLGREMARGTADPASLPERRNLVRTFELLYWLIGALLGIALAVASRFVPSALITTEKVGAAEVRLAVQLGAIALVMQWPLSLYSAGVMGLQRQTLVNALASGSALLRAALSVVVLAFWWPHAGALLLCQGIVLLAQALALRQVLWHYIGGVATPRFDLRVLRPVWRFAASVSVSSAGSLVLSQMDRLILLPVLTLSEVGYYVMAVSFAGAIATLGSPIADAVAPRYAQLTGAGQTRKAIDLFHLATQGTAVLLFPVAAVCCVFAGDVCELWARSRDVSRSVAPILAVLVAAHGLYVFSVGGVDLLQAAEGSLRTSAWGRLAAIVVVAPLVLSFARGAGAVGAAYAWLIVYGAMAFVLPLAVLLRWPSGSGSRWLLSDFLLPLVAAAGGSIVVRAAGATIMVHAPRLVLLTSAYALTLLLTLIATPALRRAALEGFAVWRQEGQA